MAEKKIVRKQTGVRIDEKMIKELKHLGVDKGRSLSSLMSEAVTDLLKKYKKH